MSRVIAITGAAGYLSQRFIPYLFHFSSDIDHFVALDIREMSHPSGIPLSYYNIDVRDEFSSVLEEQGVTDLIHMAWILNRSERLTQRGQLGTIIPNCLWSCSS